MGNSIIFCCSSNSKILLKEETSNLFQICLKRLKKLMTFHNSNKLKNFYLNLETSYHFFSGLFRNICQSCLMIENNAYIPLNSLLSKTIYIFLSLNETNEEDNFEEAKNSIREIQLFMESKHFHGLRFEKFDEIYYNLKNFNENNKDFSKDFSTIQGAKYWFENFQEKKVIEWNLFYEKFLIIFENLHYGREIPKILNIIIKDTIDVNNDLKVYREGWSFFYFKLFSDSTEMQYFFKLLDYETSYLDNTITLKYIAHPLDQNLKQFYFDVPTFFEISDKGLIRPPNLAVEKKLNENGLVFGRISNKANEIDVSFNENINEIKSKHFQIVNKYEYAECGIFSKFYLNNLSVESPISFIVQSKPYILYPNSKIILNHNIIIEIKYVYPSCNSSFSDMYFYVDPNLCEKDFFLKDEKSKQAEENPSIVLNFINENKENKFVVWHDNADFQVTIGNSFKNDITLPHACIDQCLIHYDHYDRVWTVSDATSESKNQYRTFILSQNKGIRMKQGMKFWVNGHVFKVEENYKD